MKYNFINCPFEGKCPDHACRQAGGAKGF